jgi:hypothetical protein
MAQPTPELLAACGWQRAYRRWPNASGGTRMKIGAHALASPMRNWEVNLGLSLGGAVRAIVIGLALAALSLPITGVPLHDPLVLVVSVALGVTLFSSLGVVVGIYARPGTTPGSSRTS